ncbi:hypothetical protein [Kiloniella sp. EL199]|uniref:hypothetical protein n=1 Tax=Kiloniella sp. EL199 TaxID=2107581 RepID=UPI000E9FFE6F|nr:hypothetical protein [Kiloniella sp. EL199]
MGSKKWVLPESKISFGDILDAGECFIKKNTHPVFRCIRFFSAPVWLLPSPTYDQFFRFEKKASYLTNLSTLYQGGAEESLSFKTNLN